MRQVNKTGLEEGVETRLRHTSLPRAHRAPREGRPIPPAGTAGVTRRLADDSATLRRNFGGAWDATTGHLFKRN
jgi:hypothetical protein